MRVAGGKWSKPFVLGTNTGNVATTTSEEQLYEVASLDIMCHSVPCVSSGGGGGGGRLTARLQVQQLSISDIG